MPQSLPPELVNLGSDVVSGLHWPGPSGTKADIAVFVVDIYQASSGRARQLSFSN